MNLMGQAEQEFVRQRLDGLRQGVEVVVFTRPADCESCEATEQLVREIADTVPEVGVRIVGETEPGALSAFGIDKLPAVAVVPLGDPGPDNGIRFFGFPGGYEFTSLLEAIRRVGAADPGLGPDLALYLAGRRRPLHLQVFVTQTCPYCPRTVQLAHRMALASPSVRADMVDAVEFPDLARRYGVQGVPMTVVDGSVAVTGAMSEDRLLAALRQADREVPL